MDSFKDVHDAWKKGFTDGWQSISKSPHPLHPHWRAAYQRELQIKTNTITRRLIHLGT
jgi:hypothetical protein